MHPIKLALFSTILVLGAGCSDDVSTFPSASGATSGDSSSAGGSGGGGASSVAASGSGGAMGPSWPDEMDHRTEITFKGNEIQCKLGPIPVPYQVPDCVTTLTSRITTLESGDLCEACDRTYHGPFDYLEDTCSRFAGTGEPAKEGSFGFKFPSETLREMWGKNEQMMWEKSLDLSKDAAGTWSGSVADELVMDPEDCNNGEQNLGSFEITVFFSDVE
jgi:hypothetical protein